MKSKSNRSILALLFVGVLMGALDISIVGPAIPEIARTVHLQRDALSWIFSIYVLFNLVGLPLLARLSDVFGRRSIYTLSVALFALGSLVVTLSGNFQVLLVGRAIQGFGASGIFPVAAAVIGDLIEPEKRGRALGMLGAVFGLAFMIGPVIAGIILKYFQWNTLFAVNIPIAVYLVIGSLRLLPSKRTTTMKHFDWKGISLLGLFLACFALGINDIKADHFFTSLVTAPVVYFLGAAILFFTLLISVERIEKMPVIRLSLFSRTQIRAVGAVAVGTGIFQSSFVFVPDLAVQTFSVPAHQASFMLLPVVVATAIGSPLSGRIMDKLGSRVIVLAGIVLAGIGLLTMSVLGSSLLFFYVSGVFIGFGLSMLAGPSLRYIILNEVDATERAVTQGILTMMISIGQITGSAIIGAIITVYRGDGGYSKAFLFLSLITVVMFIIAFALKSRKEELAHLKTIHN